MLKKYISENDYLNNYTELYEIDSRLKNIINPNYKSFLSEISIDYQYKIYKRTIPFLNNLKKLRKKYFTGYQRHRINHKRIFNEQ